MTDPYQTQPIPQPVPYAGGGYPQSAPMPPAYPVYPPPAPYPQAGYGYVPAPYPPVQAAPAQTAGYYYLPPVYAPAPAFMPEDVGKDPRRRKSAQDVNRMALLCFAQLALSGGWGFVLGVVFVALGIDLFAPDSLALSMMTGAAVVLSTGAVPFLFFVAGRKKTVDYLKFQKVGFFPGLLCVLAGVSLLLLLNIPAALLRDVLEGVGYESTAVETSAETGNWLGFWADFTAIALLAPMLEEIMDRGIILTTLRQYGIGFAVVASGLLFGLNHLDLTTVVFAFPAGMILGFVYARTNNLWLTIWIHMLNNGLSVISDYGGLFWPENPELVGEVLYSVALVLGLISLILVLTWKRKMFMTRRSPHYDGPAQPFTVGQSLSAMARAPMLWAFVALVGAYFALTLV